MEWLDDLERGARYWQRQLVVARYPNSQTDQAERFGPFVFTYVVLQAAVLLPVPLFQLSIIALITPKL